MSKIMSHEKIDFGFKQVAKQEKSALVAKIFDNVATKYDLMNDLMSGGLHRIWKDKMVQEVDFKCSNNDEKKNYKIIDVAGGTGDIAFRILKKAHKENINVQIDLVDINGEMLQIGQNRAVDNNLFSKLKFQIADGENLPYENQQFDYYVIAFGLRNFTDIKKGLSEAHRVLKPGGKFICLEFSQVNNLFLAKIYDLYSFNIIPKIGKFIAGDEDAYKYLVESIRKFPDQENFKNKLEDSGFTNVKYKNLNFGTVTIHSAFARES